MHSYPWTCYADQDGSHKWVVPRLARRGPAHAVTTLGIALKSFGKYVLSYIPNMVSEVETMPF